MKILMIAPEPFFEPRGTPISVYQRLRALSSLNHEIDLVTYHVGADISIPNVRIYRTPDLRFIKEVKIGPSWAKIILDLFLFITAFSLLLRRRYNAIHSHEEAAFFSIFLAGLFRVRHLYDMHSSLPRQLENFKFGNSWIYIKLFHFFESWVLHTCDAVITIDEELESYVRTINPAVRQLRIENLPIHKHPQNVDFQTAHTLRHQLALEEKLPVVYTGTFERYQGLDLLFRSAQIIKKAESHAVFILVGGKEKQIQQWKETARQYNLEDDVRFIGMVSPEESLDYLDLAEVLVSPRVEGTSVPLKIYSYMLAGKAIVATNLQAHTQVLNETIALLVDPTQDAFAEGVLQLLRAPELRQCLGTRARQFAQENHSGADYVPKINQIYEAMYPQPKRSGQSVSSVET